MDQYTVTTFLEENKTLIDKSDWKGLFNKAKRSGEKNLYGFLYYVLGDALDTEPFPGSLYGLRTTWTGRYGSPTVCALTPQNGVYGISEKDGASAAGTELKFATLKDCVAFAMKYANGDIQHTAEKYAITRNDGLNVNDYVKITTKYGPALLSKGGYMSMNKTNLKAGIKDELKEILKVFRSYAYNNTLLKGEFEGNITNDYYENKKPKVELKEWINTDDNGDMIYHIVVNVNNKSRNNPFNIEYKELEGGKDALTGNIWTYHDYVIEGVKSEYKQQEAIDRVEPEAIKAFTDKGFVIEQDPQGYGVTFIKTSAFNYYPKADAKNAAGIHGFSRDDFEDERIGTEVWLRIQFGKKL